MLHFIDFHICQKIHNILFVFGHRRLSKSICTHEFVFRGNFRGLNGSTLAQVHDSGWMGGLVGRVGLGWGSVCCSVLRTQNKYVQALDYALYKLAYL